MTTGKDKIWLREWPREPGWYWFYQASIEDVREHGEPSSCFSSRPPYVGKICLMPVLVRTGGPHQQFLLYMGGGDFLDPEEYLGWWIPMEVPSPPEGTVDELFAQLWETT